MAIDPDWPEPSGFADEDLLSLIRRQGEHYGYRRFMSFQDGSSMSFLELRDRVAGMRARLQDMGVRPGDRVALMLKNSLFYPVAWLGIVTGGRRPSNQLPPEGSRCRLHPRTQRQPSRRYG